MMSEVKVDSSVLKNSVIAIHKVRRRERSYVTDATRRQCVRVSECVACVCATPPACGERERECVTFATLHRRGKVCHIYWSTTDADAKVSRHRVVRV